MRYAVPLLLVGGMFASLAVTYDRTQVIDWVGGYPVRVTTRRTSPRPVAGASVAVLFRGEWTAAAGDPQAIDAGWRPVGVSDSAAFTIQVKCGGKDSGLGRQISYVRQEVLILWIDYADGGGALVVADIPESQSSRDMVMQVP